MLLFFLSSLLFLSNSLSLDKLPARETVADDVKMGADDVMKHIQMIMKNQTGNSKSLIASLEKLVMKNQTGNSKSLIASLEKLDPATIASVVVLVEQLLASAAADLLTLQQASELSISAYDDALNAHNAAIAEKVRLDEAINAEKARLNEATLAYQASLAQQVIVVQSSLDTKNTASGAKTNAQATLDAESPRLNSESSTLTQVLELINGLTPTENQVGVASLSSQLGSIASYGPSNCMDGNSQTTCHSEIENNPFFMMEYPTAVKVAEVRVQARNDDWATRVGKRVKDVVVYVTDTPPTKGSIPSGTQIGSTFVGPAGAGQWIIFKSANAIFGKYVVVQQQYEGYIGFAEVEVIQG